MNKLLLQISAQPQLVTMLHGRVINILITITLHTVIITTQLNTSAIKQIFQTVNCLFPASVDVWADISCYTTYYIDNKSVLSKVSFVRLSATDTGNII